MLVGHAEEFSKGYETPKQRYQAVYKEETEKRKMEEKRRRERLSRKGVCGRAAGK